MNTENLIPISYVKQFTPLAVGDVLVVITRTIGDKRLRLKSPVHAEKFNNNKQGNDEEYCLESFAARENTGKQPVDDLVVVDVMNKSYPFKALANVINWAGVEINKTWKPNHAAMLAKFKEQGANTVRQYNDQEAELATHFSGNNNRFYIKGHTMIRKAMVLNNVGRWIYSDCTTNAELDGDEFWKLDGKQIIEPVTVPEFPSDFYQKGGEVVNTDLHTPQVIEPWVGDHITEQKESPCPGKPVFTQEADETSYLLSSEKNAARIKESMAQAGLIYCDIDEDGKITPIFTQEMADSNTLPNVGVEFEMRFSNDTSPNWQLYRMANLFDCGGFSVTFIDTGKTFCYAENGAYGMEIRPSQADKGVHIDVDGDLAVGSEKVGVASQGFADSLEVGMKFMGMDETHSFTECVAIAILETSKGDSLVTYEYNDSCSVGTCWLLNEWVKPIDNRTPEDKAMQNMWDAYRGTDTVGGEYPPVVSDILKDIKAGKIHGVKWSL